MKVAITGHTQGIGKAIFEEMIKRGHEVTGYSRSNGYDISLESARDQIIKEIKDFDIFVNNAFSPQAQFELLKKITNSWDGSKKVIVNVGSKSIYATNVNEAMKSYVEDKKLQNEFIYKRKLKAKPQILNLILGLVDTEMSQIFSANKINAKDLAKLVADMIEVQRIIYVQDLVLDVPYQNWTEINFRDQ